MPATAVPETQVDDFKARLMADLGLAIGEDPKPPEQPTPAEPTGGDPATPSEEPAPAPAPPERGITTLGDRARMRDEAEKDRLAAGGAPVPPPEPVAVTPPPAAPVPPPADPAKPPVEVEKRRPLEDRVSDAVERTLKKSMPAPVPAPTAPAKPEPPSTTTFEAGLTEAQRDELEVARFAATLKPDKHKELPTKLLAFYQKLDDYYTSAQTQAGGGDRTFDEHDDEFQRFLKANKPVIDQSERRKIEREMISKQAEDRTRKAMLDELAPMRQEHHAMKTRPVIESAVREFNQGVSDLLEASGEGEIAADIAKRAKKDGWDKVAQEDPVFGAAAAHLTRSAETLASEYMAIAHGVKQYSEQDGRHRWIRDFIGRVEGLVAADPARATRDGKQFIPAAEYYQRVSANPAEANRYYTLTDRDILEHLAFNTRENVKNAMKQESERLEKSGFKRQPAADPAPGARKTETPPAKKADDPPSPRAVPSSSPGAGRGAAPPVADGMFSEREKRALGIPVRK